MGSMYHLRVQIPTPATREGLHLPPLGGSVAGHHQLPQEPP